MKKLIVSGLIVGLVMGMTGRAFSEEKTEAKMKYLDEKKSPSTALLWSLFITGAGQIYNKETTKGLLMLGGEIACIATVSDKNETLPVIGIIGINIWSWVDAYKGANRYNEKLKKKYGISLLLQENKPTLALKYNF
ncbi:MAG: hypothetical protein AAB267_06610 [Candidatus Desantisbacteria bacterium]